MERRVREVKDEMSTTREGGGISKGQKSEAYVN